MGIAIDDFPISTIMHFPAILQSTHLNVTCNDKETHFWILRIKWSRLVSSTIFCDQY